MPKPSPVQEEFTDLTSLLRPPQPYYYYYSSSPSCFKRRYIKHIMGLTSDSYHQLLLKPTIPTLTPTSSFDSDWETRLPAPPVSLSTAMAQEPIDPEDDGRGNEYTFAKLLTLIQKHNIYLPHPDGEVEEIGETAVPEDLLRKDAKEMSEEEMLNELDTFEQDRDEGRFVHAHSLFAASAEKVEPWSVNGRREKLGCDPAVTINHLAGNGEIIYHYPNRVFRLLALQEDLRAYLVSWLMAGLCFGREVKPYGYRRSDRKKGKRRRKPLVEVMIALCSSRNRKAVETLEMARCALYVYLPFVHVYAISVPF